MATWHYNGDVNPEYGGTWINLDDWDWGYCKAVRVTDLDGGCGFRGAVLVEHITINGVTDAKRIRQALESAGYVMRQFGRTIAQRKDITPEQVKVGLRQAIAQALMSYGYYDPDEEGSHDETLQLDERGPMRFDGMKATKRLHNTGLREYVESVHLD